MRQETVAKQRDAAQGKLVVDSDLEQVSLRDKIFQICSMLNELQSTAGLKLAHLETRVEALRAQFTRVTLKKNAWETEDTINQLFAKSQDLEVNRHLNDLSKRQFEQALSKDFENGIKLFSGKSDTSSANL